MAIKELQAGAAMDGFFLCSNIEVKTGSNGKNFLSGTIQDMSGSMPLKVWDYTGDLSAAESGKIVKVRGTVSDYKGAPQFIASRIRLAGEGDTYNVEELVPTAPIDAPVFLQSVEDMIADIEDKDYRSVCQEILKRNEKQFYTIPAALKVHHAFLHGLLMHTFNMMVMAQTVSSLYFDVINKDLLIAGTFLHDIGKLQEFKISELGLVTDYSVSGHLLGHLVMGAMQVEEVCRSLNVPEEKTILLQHLLLSHHGNPEWGAAVRPQTAEAEALSLIDLLDAKEQVFRETTAAMESGTFSSSRVAALDGIYVYKPMSH